MTLTNAQADAGNAQDAAELRNKQIDPLRVLCLPIVASAELAAALAGLANTRGGTILIGARVEAADARIGELAGVDAEEAATCVAELIGQLDPPIAELVATRSLELPDGRSLLIVSVRQSPSPPHLEPLSGRIFVHDAGEVRPIRRREELDRLYQRGRAADERAERLIASTIERLSLAHFNHYGLAVVASLRAPTAEPYLWFRGHSEALADPDDAFVAEWGFKPDGVRVGAGELELRNEREAAGVLRVGRAGYAVAAEIRRQPPRHLLGSIDDVAGRIERLIASVCRILGHADPPLLLPRLVCDGLKSCRLSLNGEGESVPCSLDSLHVAGAAGDARDAGYRARLLETFMRQLSSAFGLDATDDAGA